MSQPIAANSVDDLPNQRDVRQIKPSYFKKKFRIMRDLPEEVIEDPNENTYSEFPTKRTVKGKSPLNKHTLMSSNDDDSKLKLANPSSKQKLANYDAQNGDVNNYSKKGQQEINLENSNDLPNTKVPNISTIERPYFPDSKSVSLSFSSRYQGDDEEFTKWVPNNQNFVDNPEIITKMNYIRAGLDNLNRNLEKFEVDLKLAQEIENEIKTYKTDESDANSRTIVVSKTIKTDE